MGYAGSLGEIDLPSALQVLGRSGRSGILSVEGEGCSTLILLQAGRLVYASSDRVGPIGQRFVERGLVTPEKLDEVLGMQRRRKNRQLLGSLLCSLGIVSEQDAAREVENHIVAVLRDTLGWSRAEVHFDECEGSMDTVLAPRRSDVDGLLLRAVGATA